VRIIGVLASMAIFGMGVYVGRHAVVHGFRRKRIRVRYWPHVLLGKEAIAAGVFLLMIAVFLCWAGIVGFMGTIVYGVR
jgi:hypothetical protein